MGRERKGKARAIEERGVIDFEHCQAPAAGGCRGAGSRSAAEARAEPPPALARALPALRAHRRARPAFSQRPRLAPVRAPQPRLARRSSGAKVAPQQRPSTGPSAQGACTSTRQLERSPPRVLCLLPKASPCPPPDEHSLESSKNKVLRNAVHVDEADVEKCVRDIMKEKKIEQRNTGFKTKLHICLLQISGYKKLYLSVESLRKVPYDSDNKEHEEQLIELWNLLMPHESLKARISKQWCDIGFQGDDPKTDFRGMGMLGLMNLVYFSKHYTEEARQILSRSNHPKLGYSYAIVGINLTEMAYSLLKSGALKPHLYNAVSGLPQLEHFHQFYCYLVYEFDKFWFEEEPESIMHFNQYREKFHEKIKGLLLDYDVILTLRSPAKP
ncbi:PREDICTED: ELMO domain-containing protein 2 [Tinamus guttatus]|uniref:ELMO domain-containing protein 2 n=1 Tax=Tinamus guttatus TaxID=94827 RepID=UPI00052EF4BC|nr:PREDICTED: ELMO domain-containing protein 2 [Tinamus guttatus]